MGFRERREMLIKQLKELNFNQAAIDYNLNIQAEKFKKEQTKYLSNPEVQQKIKQYRSRPDIIKQRQNRYKNRILTDKKYKLKRNISSRIRIAIKKGTGIKSAHTLELLGCSIEECKTHLEKQFKDGMSWANMGKWHIDHIKPCCSFDLTKPEEQRACFHYSNLQPLCAEENLSKGGKT